MSNQEKYKVGDRVRIVYDADGYKGKLGVVTGYDSMRSVWVTLEDGTETFWSVEFIDSITEDQPCVN